MSLATETFVSRATSSNGSPRNNRAATANLRLTENRFGPFPSTPDIIRHVCTPVEAQFTSAGCLNYPCRTPAALALKCDGANSPRPAARSLRCHPQLHDPVVTGGALKSRHFGGSASAPKHPSGAEAKPLSQACIVLRGLCNEAVFASFAAEAQAPVVVADKAELSTTM